MNLSEKIFQELKDKKISIENLDDRYFVEFDETARHSFFCTLEVENVLKLLNANVCDFKEIVDKFKSIPDERSNPCLYALLKNKKLFKKLIQNKKLNTDDLRYLLNKIDEDYELDSLRENTTLLKYIVDNGVSFKELVDKHKSIENDDDPCLFMLLDNKELFEEMIKNEKLTQDNLRYLLNKIDDVDYELFVLCRNTPLIKHILNEVILDKNDVERFNTLIENDDWYKGHGICTIFEFIEYNNRNVYHNKNSEEILRLSELNEQVYLLNSFDLTTDQKLELVDVLRDNEQVQSLLKQIVDNNIEDQYDFEQLKRILTKDNDKKKFKLNF